MPSTHIKIATTTVGSGGTSEIDFTSIPSTYTDLVIMFSVRGTLNIGSGVTYMYFNNDTNDSNYSYRRMIGSGTSASSASGAAAAIDVVQGDNATANAFGNDYVYIFNYTSNLGKSAVVNFAGITNASLSYMGYMSYGWSGTSTISSIKLTSNGSFKQFSSATLYGIKKD